MSSGIDFWVDLDEDEVRAYIKGQNNIRADAGLPLYDVEAEVAAWKERKDEADYEDFATEFLAPYTEDWPQPKTHSEAQSQLGQYLRLRSEKEPEIRNAWETRIR